MALGYNKNRDLMEVFDDRWKANRENNISEQIQKQKEFEKKLYGNLGNRGIANHINYQTSKEKVESQTSRINFNKDIANTQKINRIANNLRK